MSWKWRYYGYTRCDKCRKLVSRSETWKIETNNRVYLLCTKCFKKWKIQYNQNKELKFADDFQKWKKLYNEEFLIFMGEKKRKAEMVKLEFT